MQEQDENEDDPRKKAERAALAKMIGTRLRGARYKIKLTQVDVAERIQMASEVYGRMERGKMLPSMETVVKLSVALGLSVDELLGLTGEGESNREPAPVEEERPELRRLVRRARALKPENLKLIVQVAAALANETEE